MSTGDDISASLRSLGRDEFEQVGENTLADERPAVLILDDGSRFELPDRSVREAVDLVRQALGSGEYIGGEIDPRRVETIGARLEA